MKKILVANRGEIALRIMKTARRMNIKTVAVYSDADRESLNVQYADEAIYLGPSPSKDSYLKGDLIIEKALKIGADAIHPGYGFLSENAEFAIKVRESGLTFIGPDSHAITIMGSKLAAKEAVQNYNIPLVPGTDQALTDVEEAKEIAQEIGFPILIKASAGGGGKGMRIVENREEFEEQLERAMSEARSSFGDDSVFIEKFVTNPRHIEIQILSDNYGNHLHLYERECSIQRRHQKVIEEAPSSVLSPELRAEMGTAAINVARSCNYTGAGTVEFLLDDKMNFYFLEMNTRLQVEHPVTEFITGLDLVEQQILIAQGKALSYTQEDIPLNGHAIELRIYAEDPMDNFLPSIGKLETYKLPTGAGIRVDNAYVEGMDIPIFYDPMIAKLVTYANNRENAIQLMIEAINNYKIEGIESTLDFGRFVMEHEAFVSGEFSTNFVKDHFSPETLKEMDYEKDKIAALMAGYVWEKYRKEVRLPIS